MANHTIVLTVPEESVFQKLLVLAGLTEEQAIDQFAKSGLTSQAMEYLDDACKNKLDGMTASEKIAFLL